MVDESKENRKLIIVELSEREIGTIRKLIWDKIESLVNEKDNLDDPEYGVLYHVKIGLLESLAEKFSRQAENSHISKTGAQTD